MNFMDKGQGCHGQGKTRDKQGFFKVREKSGNIRENLRCLLKSVKSQAISFSFRKAICKWSILILFVACLWWGSRAPWSLLWVCRGLRVDHPIWCVWKPYVHSNSRMSQWLNTIRKTWTNMSLFYATAISDNKYSAIIVWYVW